VLNESCAVVLHVAVASLLELAAPITSHASFLGRSTRTGQPSTFTRRGLQNYQNTCFLNCVMQCLLHCDEFWIYCSRLHALLSAVDPHLESITETTDGPSTGQAHHSAQSNQACDFARTIPITHELVAFAAHFRRISRAKKQEQRSAEASGAPPAVPPSDPAHEAVVAASFDETTATAASSETPSAAADASTPSVDTLAATLASTSLTNESPAASPATTTSCTSSSKSKPAKKKKKPAGDKDDAFLDRLLQSATAPAAAKAVIDPLEEEERRKAKNRKKKEKEKVAKAKDPEAATPVQAAPLAEEQKSTESTTGDIPLVDANGIPLSNAQRKKLRRAAEAAAAAASNGESKVAEPSPAAPPAAVEPVDDKSEGPATVDPAAPSSEAAQPTAIPKKQARVHRVEDEEEWSMPVGTKAKLKQPASASTPKVSKASPAAATNSSSSCKPTVAPTNDDTTSALAQPTILGVASTTQPFLPAFPALLRAFQTHRQGQQEDAQELLQILCENVQAEWTAWTGPWQRGVSSSSSQPIVPAEDEWNEVGKGSKAIKVVSNLSFAPSPLSRLFCGRVRSQLSVATRAQDTMSFQPFFTLHLDIDDEQAAQEYSEMPVAKSKHKHRKAQMSVDRALERYMCPSEISGYKKKNAPVVLDQWGYQLGQQTTKALHMHALDSHALPRIFVLHLKRFEPSGSVGVGRPPMQKNSKHVKFHSQLPMPARYLSTATGAAAADSGVTYTLVGVVVHHGHSMAGGHYTAFVRDRSAELEFAAAEEKKSASKGASASKKQSAPARSSYDSSSDGDDEDKPSKSRSRRNSDAALVQRQQREIWYHCDDARITPVAAHTVYTQCAYLLFYTLDERVS
jgi:hypothetical protein